MLGHTIRFAVACVLVALIAPTPVFAATTMRLQLAGDQSLSDSDFTQLRWAAPAAYVTNDRPAWAFAEVYAPHAMFDPAKPAYAIVPADSSCRIWVSAKFDDRDRDGRTRRDGRRAVAIQMNDEHLDILDSRPADPGGTTSIFAGIDLFLRAGERISVWLEQQSGGTLSAVGHSAKDTTMGLACEEIGYERANVAGGPT